MKELAYRDALNYAPIDVIKGMDLVTKEIVGADDKAPAGYEAMPKCKFCKNYTADDETTGVCEASMNKPKFMAYGDMSAGKCEMFEMKKE